MRKNKTIIDAGLLCLYSDMLIYKYIDNAWGEDDEDFSCTV